MQRQLTQRWSCAEGIHYPFHISIDVQFSQCMKACNELCYLCGHIGLKLYWAEIASTRFAAVAVVLAVNRKSAQDAGVRNCIG